MKLENIELQRIQINGVICIEEFRYIKGYDEIYSVSNFGRIFSHERNVSQINSFGGITKRIYGGYLLKPKNIKSTGYQSVCLTKNKKESTILLHRLVAMAFIPNPESKPEVNHKNGIKTDNQVENLEWNTKKENVRHAYENGLSKSGGEHIQSIQIFQYSIDRQFIKEWGSAGEIKRKTGMTIGCICSCARGERPSAHGFFWSRQKLS